MVGHWRATGPITLQGATPAPQSQESQVVTLQVVGRPGGLAVAADAQPATVHPTTLSELHGPCGDGGAAGLAHGLTSCFATLADGSDCVLTLRASDAAAPGCIVMDEVQQFNMHMLAGDPHGFRRYVPPTDEPSELVDVDVEVRLLPPLHQPPSGAARGGGGRSSGSVDVNVDAAEVAAVLARQHFGRVLAVNELLVVEAGDVRLLARITAAHTLPAAERDDVIGYHCYRGLLSPTTTIFVTGGVTPPAQNGESANGASTNGGSANGAIINGGSANDAAESATDGVNAANEGNGAHDKDGGGGSAAAAALMARLSLTGTNGGLSSGSDGGGSLGGGGFRLHLHNTRERKSRPPPTDVVHVTTSDGEWFPVKKRLLRPCLALTRAVRDAGDVAARADVDVDTLTFDRVLIFLEAHALGRPPPQWSLHLVEPLAKAAEVLSCRPLLEYCQGRLGQMAQGVRIHRFGDVVTANAAGKLWLILDSMVLDIKSWLPEHPGGSSIIPRQSLNCDCARFFEMYHASRESFLYLRDFYLGEIHPDDRALVPQGGEDRAGGRAAEPPGPDFLQQLREFTEAFRLKLGPGGELLHAAYADVRTHLGARS